jgi:S-disulfanyl-L-cysteine oxidoreductase SoxD
VSGVSRTEGYTSPVSRKLVIAAALTWAMSAIAGVRAQETARIWQGAFTEAQAARGKKEFDSACIRCHGADLNGVSAPALKGDRFTQTFGNGSVDQLFAKIRDTMPPNFGTSISDEAKIDVVSYILQTNGFPAVPREMSKADDLAPLLIVRKGEPATVRDFSLVQTVGCLTKAPDGAWMLTSSAEPAPTRDDVPGKDALSAAAARTLGAGRFLLLHAAPHKPADHQGHKMEARGLIYNDPAGSRITLTSLQMVGATCN